MTALGASNSINVDLQLQVDQRSSPDRSHAVTTEPAISKTPAAGRAAVSSDEVLVGACLGGEERAWGLLIDRYKHLIYSIARRYGAGQQDAADVFQQVCLELFTALPRLRNQHSVSSWIMTVAAHEAYRWKRRRLMRVRHEDNDAWPAADSTPAVSRLLERAESEQAVREAIARLSARNRELVRLLFFEDPPIPYHLVATRLGVAPGSVCFIRMRCLKKLEPLLKPHRSGRRT
jgi:RNA polymerase sigma factor (sigma-70 family)